MKQVQFHMMQEQEQKLKLKLKKKSFKSSYYSAILKKITKPLHTCMEQGQFPPKQLNHGFDHH